MVVNSDLINTKIKKQNENLLKKVKNVKKNILGLCSLIRGNCQQF